METGEDGGDDDSQVDVVMGQDGATHSSNSGDDVPPKAQQSASVRNAGGHGRAREKGKERAPGRARNPQSRPPRRAASSRSRSTSGEQRPGNSQTARGEDDAPLRELFRKAYSRESLHTYKSDPLHRGKGRPALHRGGTKGTRRGQPDMKLRMNALLEKIKRGVAAG